MSKPLILELKEKATKKVLWEKDSSVNTFTGQTITLSSDDYDYLIIFSHRTPASHTQTIGTLVEKNQTTEIQYGDYFVEYPRAWSRKVDITDGTNVKFYDATINGSVNNGALIPYKILGCKY